MLLTFRIGHDDGVLVHTLRAMLYTGESRPLLQRVFSFPFFIANCCAMNALQYTSARSYRRVKQDRRLRLFLKTRPSRSHTRLEQLPIIRFLRHSKDLQKIPVTQS